MYIEKIFTEKELLTITLYTYLFSTNKQIFNKDKNLSITTVLEESNDSSIKNYNLINCLVLSFQNPLVINSFLNSFKLFLIAFFKNTYFNNK